MLLLQNSTVGDEICSIQLLLVLACNWEKKTFDQRYPIIIKDTVKYLGVCSTNNLCSKKIFEKIINSKQNCNEHASNNCKTFSAIEKEPKFNKKYNRSKLEYCCIKLSYVNQTWIYELEKYQKNITNKMSSVENFKAMKVKD